MSDDLNDSDMKALLKDLPRSIEPPRDLYPAIGARVAARHAERGHRRQVVWLVLAAAVALVAASSAVTAWLLRQSRPPVVAVLPADARVVEAGYVQAAEDLQQLLASSRVRLAPATVTIIQRNLAVIDRAIRESRDALARDPRNQEAARLLWETYQQKLDLLQRAARLGQTS
ncbi:MAG TPA: hypothetical protein VGI83_08910 [Gemmatimonadales bacterium]